MSRKKIRKGVNLHDRLLEIREENKKYFLIEKSHILKKVENELEYKLGQCRNRRAHRRFTSKQETIFILDYNKLAMKFRYNKRSFLTQIPDNVSQRYGFGQTRTFNAKQSISVISRDKSIRFLPDSVKISGQFAKQELSIKGTRSVTYSVRLNHFKEDSSEGRMSSIKIKKHDFKEIMNQLSLCYTYQLIEISSRTPDKSWSGTDIPCIDNRGDFVFVGGYGHMDGVTECNNINLAAKKYQNIDFSHDEAVEALSHMYSMSHLIDSIITDKRKESQRIFLQVISDDEESEDSKDSVLFSE